MSFDREIRPFRLRLVTGFRGLLERRGCLIEGERGWGEFAPFDDYGPEQDARWLASAIEQADRRWPQVVRQEVEVNAIVPALDPAAAARFALASGCRTIKIKVGDAAGFERVAAVREALPDALLRVDVNAGWSVGEAIAGINELARLGLEYVEQPVRTRSQMRQVRDAVDVPLAADELIRRDRCFELADVADVAVLKVGPLGGVAATLDIAQRVGLPVVVSSALDSSLGLAAGLAAACALPDPPLACGLGTGALLAEDTTLSLRPERGRMAFAGYPAPGSQAPVFDEDRDYWLARIEGAVRAVPK